jgi:hypothetical protein
MRNDSKLPNGWRQSSFHTASAPYLTFSGSLATYGT